MNHTLEDNYSATPVCLEISEILIHLCIDS